MKQYLNTVIPSPPLFLSITLSIHFLVKKILALPKFSLFQIWNKLDCAAFPLIIARDVNLNLFIYIQYMSSDVHSNITSVSSASVPRFTIKTRIWKFTF